MIDEADRDGDGEVNEEEFLRIMKTLGFKLQPVTICLSDPRTGYNGCLGKKRKRRKHVHLIH